jgi:hypothetical protein
VAKPAEEHLDRDDVVSLNPEIEIKRRAAHHFSITKKMHGGLAP